MADIGKCQNELIALAEKQGYLTFDDILDISDLFSLSVTEVDILSEAIHLRGIIVYETKNSIKRLSEDEEYLDYSRTDYDSIFAEVLTIAPQLKVLIEAIKSYPAPQYGEINQLAMQVASGNRFARERLITLYMRNVVKIALSMSKQYEYELEDAISSGFAGLSNAVDRFDLAGFSAFHSYASLWITQGIQRYCCPTWMEFYFPAHYKERLYRVLQRYNQYANRNPVGTSEYNNLIVNIAEELKMKPVDVSQVLERAYNQKHKRICFEDLVEQDAANNTLIPHELVLSDEVLFESIFQTDTESVIDSILSTSLPAREQTIVRMRFGIGYDSPMTLEEIGSFMGLTRERIRQIESKALRRLLHKRRSDLLQLY